VAAAELPGAETADDPASPYGRLAAGEAYLLEGNYFWAVKELGAAVALFEEGEFPASERAKAALLLCMALVKTGQWEDAVDLCAPPADSPPGLLPLFDYYGGVAAFRSGDSKRAAVRLGTAGNLVSPEFALSKARFDRLAYGSIIGVSPGPRASLGTGFYYDTNALMAPDDPAAVGLPEGTDTASWRSALWTSLGYVPRNFGRYQANISADAYRSFNTKPPADALDATDLSGALSLGRYSVSEDSRSAWQARYKYRLTFLDGAAGDGQESPTVEDEFFAFMETHSASLGPTWWSKAGNSLALQYTFSHQRFAELVRNGMLHSLATGQDLSVATGLRFNFGQTVGFMDSTAAYRRWIAGLGTTATYSPNQSWTFVMGLTGQYENYFDSDGYFDPAVSRADWLYLGKAEVSRSLWGGISAGIYGGTSGRVSSVDLLSYNKFEGGLTLNWSSEAVR